MENCWVARLENKKVDLKVVQWDVQKVGSMESMWAADLDNLRVD